MVTSADIAAGLQHARGDPLSSAQLIEILKDASTVAVDVAGAVTDIMAGELDPVLIADAAIKLLKAYNAVADAVNVVTGGQTLPPVPVGQTRKAGDPPPIQVSTTPINPFGPNGGIATIAAGMACWMNAMRPIPYEIPDSITKLNFQFTVPYASCFSISPSDLPPEGLPPPIEEALLSATRKLKALPATAFNDVQSAFQGIASALSGL